MANDTKLTISGDSTGAVKALADVEKKARELQKAMDTIGKAAAIGFAALTAEIGFAVKAFAEGEEATASLTQAMQNQGIYSQKLAAEYKNMADKLETLTGIDGDAITASQALLQSMIGQTKITEELEKSILDLSVAKKIDLQSATELVAKGINGQTAGLQKLGIQIDENLTKEQRLIAIQDTLNTKYGDQANASKSLERSLGALNTSFGNLQKAIGEQFAPAVKEATTFLINMMNAAKENKVLIEIATHVIAIGFAVTGAITGIYLFSKALKEAKIVMEALKITTQGLTAATGIGLLLIVGTEIYLNWSSIWPRMQAIYQTFVNNISALSDGLGTVLSGVFTGSWSKIKEGFTKLKTTVVEGYNEAFANLKPVEVPAPVIGQDKGKADLAGAEAERVRNAERQKTQILQEEQELRFMKLTEASEQEIALETEKIALLKQMQETKNAEELELLRLKYEEVSALKDEQHALDMEKNMILEEEILAQNAEFQAMDQEQKAAFLEQNKNQLLSQVQTEDQIRKDFAKKKLQEDIAARKQFIEDEQRHGKAYATINQMMHSEVYQGTKRAFGEMAQLQNSSNETLKGIGKAAAIANIAIRTAESAMAIFAGFSTIPIVGPSLGLAGAAAAIAYGAEQIGKVNAAQDGGLVEGGIQGRDSVPFLLEPGELVVPKRNFSDVVNAVANKKTNSPDFESSEYGGGQVMVSISMDGAEAERVLTARQVEARALGTIRERS